MSLRRPSPSGDMQPYSAFLAEGSAVTVYQPTRIA